MVFIYITQLILNPKKKKKKILVNLKPECGFFKTSYKYIILTFILY